MGGGGERERKGGGVGVTSEEDRDRRRGCGERAHMSDVLLQVLQAEGTHHKPQLEGAEAPAEGNLPVLSQGLTVNCRSTLTQCNTTV